MKLLQGHRYEVDSFVVFYHGFMLLSEAVVQIITKTGDFVLAQAEPGDTLGDILTSVPTFASTAGTITSVTYQRGDTTILLTDLVADGDFITAVVTDSAGNSRAFGVGVVDLVAADVVPLFSDNGDGTLTLNFIPTLPTITFADNGDGTLTRTA